MIKTLFLCALTSLALVAAPAAYAAAPEIGKPAPEFTGKDTSGESHKLSDFKGKVVVLEWTNPECPFVKKHYESKNMQKLQENSKSEGVIWLSINSSAKDKQGNQTPETANTYMTTQGSNPTARLLDPSGEIGKLYDARTTPHIFIIDQSGTLVYNGAIDDNDSANPSDVATSKNYVRAALDEVIAGKKVTMAQTKPYGCSVKY